MAVPTSIRIDAETRRKIEALVERGDLTNVTEFIKYAIRVTLRDYSGRAITPPPLGPRTMTAIAVD